ncbi:hypothetical protein [Pseudomonas fluorescens]|uniref:hypothetical protein n=1 Tax=Pseudomonas fluorescens TaxID=294 RepID=UPI00058A67EA|nr:hypothetical protein [Pseudomonas fluorescens]CEL28672.1 hypothetical protein SRM1_02019 [Pseudomonas fluorescens]
MKQDQSDTRLLDRSLKVGLILIFSLLVIAAVVYLSIFNNGLSKAPDNWSAFGSFFGGVFGPVISLVTLFAILKTIDLQKQLLSTQRKEFDDLSKLQRDSNDVQVEQAGFSKLSDYKSHQLQLLDQQITMFERMHDRYSKEVEQIKLEQDFLNMKAAHLRGLNSSLQETDKAASDLVRLSIEISLGDFESVEQLRNRVSERLGTIHPYYSNLINAELAAS